jgi:hypothetical protein
MQEQVSHTVIASRAQLATIEKVVGQISIGTLREDLLDHLCCAVEEQMEEGTTFEEALENALQQLAPDGLLVIQKETIELLNSTTIHMKRLTYSVGLLSAMSFAVGFLFALLHLRGATLLQIGGFLSFSFIFLPIIGYDYLKNVSLSRFDRRKFMAGLGSGLLVGIATIMKVLHLTGANETLIIGWSIFIFVFLPFLFFSLYKKSTSQG